MTRQSLFDRIDNRIALDRAEGDYAYFQALSLKLEYVTKIVTSGVIACIGEDVDRHRYSLEHKLVRANSIGEWVEALNDALIGPPAQCFDSNALSLVRDLTERVGSGDWRYLAVTHLNQAAAEVGAKTQLGRKVALRQFFEIGTTFRNRSRGHGAPTSAQCGRSCSRLADGLDAVVRRLRLFELPWAYLHRNLSGKYRVSPLLGDTFPFDYLKSERDVQFPNGVFLYLEHPVHIPLVFSDPDVLDIALPNGDHKESTFSTLSYVTNEVVRQDGSAWSEFGPKAVSPQVITQRDISRAAVELLEPSNSLSKGFEPGVFFQECLAEGTIGPTLFVLDNFETLQSPNDVFKWVDTHIRHPNKVLITTRFRDFNGDYAIKIGGMTDEQAGQRCFRHQVLLR